MVLSKTMSFNYNNGNIEQRYGCIPPYPHAPPPAETMCQHTMLWRPSWHQSHGATTMMITMTTTRIPWSPAQARITMTRTSSSLHRSRSLLRQKTMVEPTCVGICWPQRHCASVAAAPRGGGAGTHCCWSSGATLTTTTMMTMMTTTSTLCLPARARTMMTTMLSSSRLLSKLQSNNNDDDDNEVGAMIASASMNYDDRNVFFFMLVGVLIAVADRGPAHACVPGHQRHCAGGGAGTYCLWSRKNNNDDGDDEDSIASASKNDKDHVQSLLGLRKMVELPVWTEVI